MLNLINNLNYKECLYKDRLFFQEQPVSVLLQLTCLSWRCVKKLNWNVKEFKTANYFLTNNSSTEGSDPVFHCPY